MSQQRSGGARDLVITCIKGDGKFLKFWALPNTGLETVKSFESRLGILKQELDSASGYCRSDQIPIGLRCVVKSKIKQNRWCRAGVLAYQGYDTVVVRLLDYGNDEVIFVSDLRNIDDPIMITQPQAIECILADVMPIHDEWTVEAIKFCEQHLLYNTLSCYVVSEYMKLPVVRVAKKGENEAFVQRLINGGLALIKREITTPPPLSYKMNTLDPNSKHLVRVSHCESGHKFYVQLSAAEMELRHLMDSINRLPKDNFSPLKVPAVNTPCLAALSTNPATYYRTLITQIQQSQCKVFFVDYGVMETKDIHELRVIPPTFLSLAAQAICCSFPREVHVDPEEFARLCRNPGLNGHLQLHVVSRNSESYIVRLFFNNQDILMLLQTAQNYSPQTAQNYSPQTVQNYIPQTVQNFTPQPFQNYIPQKLKIDARCEVTVSYVNDISEFYCQPIQSKDQLNMISNILNSGYNFLTLLLNECVPGKPVCAKFSEDNLWYRACIKKVNHESDIEVFFVDFGNFDNVNLCDVRKIGPDLLKYPVQAFKCFLHETPLPTDSKARDDAFDLLEELTADQNLVAYINSFAGDAGYGITLYDINNTQLSVNEKLLLRFMSIPVVPVDDIEDVYITSFDSCKSFFGQFEKLDSDKLSSMQEEINKFYEGKQNSSFVPNEGTLVCARFPEDEQFYRARVEKCINRQCNVFFIDYGNRESIPLADVHIIDARFTRYPQFGTECAFIENFASKVPSDKLSEIMLENSFRLKMIKKEGDIWHVSLVENFSGNDAILKLVKQFEISNASAKPRRDEKIIGHQEKRFNSQTSHSDSWNDNTYKASNFVKKNEVVNSYNMEPPKKESFKIPEPAQEFEGYSQISIPPKACRNIFVSHIESPGEFYCQIEEDSTKLQLLMKHIEDIYSFETDNLRLSNFVVDAPCCAMYSDGIWYRGKIKTVNVDTCEVFFVDYGNTDSVPKSKVKKLQNDLFRWPSQAVCCKAFNISPKSEDWSDEEIDAFTDKALEKSFIAQFVECDSKNCYAVNLFSIGKLESNIFNKEFVNLGYGRLQDSNKSIILNPHAASTNLTFNAPDIKIGCSESVQVFYGLNPGEIFCQLKSYEQEFKQMMIKMQNYYKNVSEAESLIDRPYQGMICAAQFSLDSAWYRAEIKKVETNKVIVFYVDYGNSENVDRKKVKCIIQEYTVLPVQALKCRIRGIKPPGKTWTINNNLGKYFEGDAVCKFISKEEDSYLVDITCNQQDVARLLISDGLAASDGSADQIKNEYPNTVQAEMPKLREEKSLEVDESKIQKLAKRTDSFVKGQLLSVTISFIENPLKFWCQLLEESDILNELIEKIENEITGCPSANPSSLTIGSYCMAQYSEDEAWYRAQIISCETESTYKVFFIDYGNSELVSISEMKMMIPELTKQPPLCFECRLHNAPSKLLSEMTTLFSDTVADVEEITAKIENVHSDICIVTLLFDKDDQEMNVNELLFGVKEDVIESGDISHESPRFLPPDVPLGPHDGYVSVVKSPEDFYIQLSGTEDPLADLSEELAELSESSLNVNPANLCVGYACSTQYSEDNNWYRAEVIDIQDSTVTVLFVDYGNIESVEKSTLKCLTEKHLQMPSQAIKCKLNGIVPAGEEWTEEAISTFQDMVLDASLGITFISKDIPATVNITKDDKEVAQCLVDMELANFESCTETDEAYAEDHLAPAPIEDPLSSLPNDQSYPERKLSSLKHVVKICYVDSCDKFYITPLELSTELDTVTHTLEILFPESAESENSKSTITDVLEDPKISMPCIAKYSEDSKWYRAIITEIEDENIFVTFIDYGNSEISNLANLRPLPPELLKIPPIALECSLFGIVAKEGKEQEITTKLEEYFLDEVELEVEIIEFSPYKVKLFLNGDDIAVSLIKEGLAEEQCILPSVSETFVDSSKMTFVDESLEYRIQISKRFFSGADKIIGNVKFCEIENDLIVFHVVSTDLEDDLQDLQQKLQDAYSEPSRNLANISCMEFCATKYMEDENWYRAQILSVEKDKIKVRFIDYGNCETVDKSDIYELLGDFTIEPQFSVKCILFGLKVDKNKEIELQNKLDEYVYHEPVELKLCKHSHAVCDLCITSVVCGNTDITELISDEKLVYPQYIINGHVDAIFKATVQKIENGIVYLLPISVIDEREAFQCKLQNICKDLDKLKEIQVDHLCAAKVDDTWYRVSVVTVSENEVTVDLVDFGFTKVTKISEFVPLPLDICHQPIFLQPCVVHVTEDSTGNAKAIHVEDLSIGCEVSCELQKNYPIMQPLSVKIIEVHSSLENIDNKNEEVHFENDTTINDSESSTNDIKISELEFISGSEKEHTLQNENETENDELNVNIEKESESFTGHVDSSEAKPCVESEVEKYFSEDENETENFNQSEVNNSESFDQEIKVVTEPIVNAEAERYFSEDENEAEKFDEGQVNDSECFDQEIKVVTEPIVDTEAERYFSEDENEAEKFEQGQVNDSESFDQEIKVSATKPIVDSEVEQYFSEDENVAENFDHGEINVENYNDINESESFDEEIKVSVTEPTVNFEKDDFMQNEMEIDEFNEVSCEKEPNVDSIENTKENENLESSKSAENKTEDMCVKIETNAELNETVSDGSKSDEFISDTREVESSPEKEHTMDTNEFNESFNENNQEISETVDFENKNNELHKNILNPELEFSKKSDVCEDSNTTLQNDIGKEILDSTTHATPNEHIHLNSDDTLNEHLKETIPHEDKCNEPEDETRKNNNIIDHNESFSEVLNNNQNSVDNDFTSQLKHEEETSSSSHYCSENDKYFNEENVANSFEDTEPKENNRDIEETYQLTGLVSVKVSDVAISDGSVIFAVQPLYLQEEFLLLKKSIQEFYSTKAVPYDVNSGSQFCVVYHEGEWCRGKILQSGNTTILLIDYGKCIDSSDIKKLDDEHSNVPPFAVWCTLFSATCPPEKRESARTFLCDKLKDTDAVIKILEGGEPYKINMHVNGVSILNQLLQKNLVKQKLPNMYLESGSHKAKLSFLNIIGGTVHIFVNLSSFCDDYNALSEDMQKTYKLDDFVDNIVESGLYAIYYNEFWYRGLVISSGKETRVYLVDTGETVIDCKDLCFLLPEHCLQPAFAIPCRIPFSDIQATDEILESINGVLKAAEFLVNIKLCPTTNSLSATLIDEQIMSEVKNIGLTCASADKECVDVKTENSIDIDAPVSVDSRILCADSSLTTVDVQKHDISDSTDTKLSCTDSSSEQFVGYLEETFTAES